MPLDFSPLQTIDPAGAFYRGQEAARAEQDRRMARQFQMEQGLAQRENIQAQRAEREAMARRRGQEEEEARRRRESLDKAAEMLAKAGANLDLPTLNQGLAFAMQSGNQEAAKVMSQLRSDFIAQQEYERETKRIFGGGVEPANALAASAVGGGAGPAMPTGAPPTGEAPAGAAPVNAMMAPPGVTRERVQQMMMSPSARMQAQGKALAPTLEKGPSTPDVATMQALGFPLTPQGYADYRKAQREEKAYEPSELQKTLDDLRKAPPGSPEAKALQARVQMLTTREPKEPREPREPPAPIPVVDPATGQIKYVPREQAVGMTPPQFIEGLTPKERQQREAKLPQATSALKTFENTSSTLEKDLETLAKHPGLSSITGIAAGRIPGITPAGREAEALYDKIVARGGFQELQNMRQASPTGGALGNVSNQEGAQLRQAFAALDRRQDANSVRKAINDAIQQIRASRQNVREAYDLTYEYKQRGGEAPAPTPSPAQRAPAAGAGRYQSLSNEELLRQLGVKPGGR